MKKMHLYLSLTLLLALSNVYGCGTGPASLGICTSASGNCICECGDCTTFTTEIPATETEIVEINE